MMDVKFITIDDIPKVSKYDRAFLLGYYASSRRVNIYEAERVAEVTPHFFDLLRDEYVKYLIGENIKIEPLTSSDYNGIDLGSDNFHIPSYVVTKPSDAWKSLAQKLNKDNKEKDN